MTSIILTTLFSFYLSKKNSEKLNREIDQIEKVIVSYNSISSNNRSHVQLIKYIITTYIDSKDQDKNKLSEYFYDCYTVWIISKRIQYNKKDTFFIEKQEWQEIMGYDINLVPNEYRIDNK